MKLKVIVNLGLVIACALMCTTKVEAQAPVKPQIHYLTDTTLNFNGLISQFKGKVIYVDVWASWCGPCLRELQAKKEVNAFETFAQRNDVVLLYICADNDGKSWKQFISANKLNGYHVLAGSNLNKDFHTVFSSVQTRAGKLKRSFYLPRHFIVDQTGAVVDSTAGRQGSAAVYTSIKSILSVKH